MAVMAEPGTSRGVAYAIGAAVTFGITAPIAKRLLTDVPPVPLASLLYLGAGIGLGAVRVVGAGRGEARESGVRRADVPTLATLIVVGGLIGPVLLLMGLQRVSGVVGALLLNLEAPLTMLLAVAFFGEHLGGRALEGALLILAGAVGLSAQLDEMRGDVIGVGAIAGACLAWAVDNNLAARLALRDPVAVAQWKTLGAGALGAALAVGLGHGLPPAATTCVALFVGFVGYGLSIVLAVKAMRVLGAARQAALFAIAPFVSVLAAVPILGEALGRRELAVAAVMVGGLVLMWRERHAHLHTHEPLAHEHLHVHDEHHQHAHEHAGAVDEPHSHAHVHTALTHSHAHVSEAHHRHRH
jgi:drug/metabolite transporter (DMT)-like permease